MLAREDISSLPMCLRRTTIHETRSNELSAKNDWFTNSAGG